jgi:predicted secreted Zn-dependent protease
MVEHVGAVMSLAQRLAAMVPEVREGMCHAIASAPYSLTASREVAAHNATAMSVAAAQPMLPVTAPGVGMGMSVSTATAPVPAVFGGNKPSGGLTMFRSIAGM